MHKWPAAANPIYLIMCAGAIRTAAALLLFLVRNMAAMRGVCVCVCGDAVCYHN
jgi:hypothetical protein